MEKWVNLDVLGKLQKLSHVLPRYALVHLALGRNGVRVLALVAMEKKTGLESVQRAQGVKGLAVSKKTAS